MPWEVGPNDGEGKKGRQDGRARGEEGRKRRRELRKGHRKERACREWRRKGD